MSETVSRSGSRSVCRSVGRSVGQRDGETVNWLMNYGTGHTWNIRLKGYYLDMYTTSKHRCE